jgi:uncharacterized membrane protein
MWSIKFMSSLPSPRSLSVAALWVGSLAYPFVVYFTIRTVTPILIVAGLLAVLGLRLLFARTGERRNLAPYLFGAIGTLSLAYWVPTFGLKVYPIVVNLGLAIVFGLSLMFTPTAIERIARIREPHLSPAGVSYTRKVTVVWTAFFLINAGISVWTVVAGSLELWTIYNGLIAYVAIGVVFATEYAVRLTLRNRLRHPT